MMHEPTKEEAMGIAAVQEIATLRAQLATWEGRFDRWQSWRLFEQGAITEARLERYREALEWIYSADQLRPSLMVQKAREALAPDASKEER